MLGAGLLPATPADAQSSGSAGSSPFDDWARHWRPLEPLGELPRSELIPWPAPDLFLLPAPRVGSFWTAGNPAGLREEVTESWTAFGAGHGVVDGDFRRPLDAVREEADALHILSWQPVSDWGAAAGEVQAGVARPEPSSFARWLEPYQGTPFVLTDTALVDMRRFETRAEGALGVGLGGWGLGVAGSYSAADNRTQASGLPRDQETVGWGFTLGALRKVAGDALRVGVYGRGQGETDETILNPVEETGEVRILQGFAEPRRIPLDRPRFRRLERRGGGIGVTMDGKVGGLRWVLFGDRSWKDETQTGEPLAEEDEEDIFDRWTTDRTRAGAALQHRFGRFLFTGRAEGATLTGEARIPEVGETVFDADVWRVEGSGELRLLPGRSGWSVAAVLGYWRTERDRRDLLAGIGEDLTLVRTFGGLSVGRWLGDRVALSTGLALALHNAEGLIPNADEQGERYRDLVAPELAYDGAEATAYRFRTTLMWRTGGRAALWARWDYATASPKSGSGAAHPIRPGGDRDRWGVTLGVRMGAATRTGRR